MSLIKLTFAGDIMMPGYCLKDYFNGEKYDFDSIFCDVKKFLEKSDYCIGNLETPISDDYKDLKNEKYRFTSPVSFAESVKHAGFNFVSLANNHCLDNGISGIGKTLEALSKIGLSGSGIFYNRNEIFYTTIKGVKFSFLSYTYGTNAFSNHVYLKKNDEYGVNLLQRQENSSPIRKFIYENNFLLFRIIRKVFSILRLFDFNLPIFERKENYFLERKKLKKEIKDALSNSDVLIFLLHDGGQFNKKISKRIKKNIRFLKKNGVDFIVSAHEHVLHPVYFRNNQVTAFSLGNFNSTYGVIEEPYNIFSEYSILLNLYFDTEDVNIKRVTFSMIKSVKEESNKIKVVFLDDLYNCTKDKKILDDANKIYRIITGRYDSLSNIEREYELFQITK